MCIIFIYEYIVNQGHVNVNKYIFFIAQDDEFFLSYSIKYSNIQNFIIIRYSFNIIIYYL